MLPSEKSFHSGSKTFSSDTDPAAAGVAAASAVCTYGVVVGEALRAPIQVRGKVHTAEAAAAPAAAGSVSEENFFDPE